MKQYKPEYLGQIMPIDNADDQNNFVQNQFDSFNKIYDVCKDQSPGIKSIGITDTSATDDTSLSVIISANSETIQEICKKADESAGVTLNNNVITAVSDKK